MRSSTVIFLALSFVCVLFRPGTSKSTFDYKEADLIHKIENILTQRHIAHEKEAKESKVAEHEDLLKDVKILYASDRSKKHHASRLFSRTMPSDQNRVFIKSAPRKAIELTLAVGDLFCSISDGLLIMDASTYETVDLCQQGGNSCVILSSGPGLMIASNNGDFVVQYSEIDSQSGSM